MKTHPAPTLADVHEALGPQPKPVHNLLRTHLGATPITAFYNFTHISASPAGVSSETSCLFLTPHSLIHTSWATSPPEETDPVDYDSDELVTDLLARAVPLTSITTAQHAVAHNDKTGELFSSTLLVALPLLDEIQFVTGDDDTALAGDVYPELMGFHADTDTHQPEELNQLYDFSAALVKALGTSR